MVVTVYSATLTWPHAVMLLMVHTMETGTSPMALCCNSQISCSISLRFVEIIELICDTEEEVMSHLVYIAVLLRPMQSRMTMVGRLCMQDCMPVEVRRT